MAAMLPRRRWTFIIQELPGASAFIIQELAGKRAFMIQE